MKCDFCKKHDDIYPEYGLAPHYHDLAKTGSIIGSTKFLPREGWPDNFVEDEEDPGCGVYFCPNPECENSKHNLLYSYSEFWRPHWPQNGEEK